MKRFFLFAPIFLFLFLSCENEVPINEFSYEINGIKTENNSDTGYRARINRNYDKNGNLISKDLRLYVDKIMIYATDTSLTDKDFSAEKTEFYYANYDNGVGYLKIIEGATFTSNLIIAEFAATFVNQYDSTDTIKIENGKLKMSLTHGSTHQTQ